MTGATTPVMRQLETALARIGVTSAHKQIIALIIVGALFDSFEQNTIGVAGPGLRAQWHLSGADIGVLNTITFGSAAAGRLLSGMIGDRYGRRVMLGLDLRAVHHRIAGLRSVAVVRRAVPGARGGRVRRRRRTVHGGDDAVGILFAEVPRHGDRTCECRGRRTWQFPGTRVRPADLLAVSRAGQLALAVRLAGGARAAGGVLSPLCSGDATLPGVARPHRRS